MESAKRGNVYKEKQNQVEEDMSVRNNIGTRGAFSIGGGRESSYQNGRGRASNHQGGRANGRGSSFSNHHEYMSSNSGGRVNREDRNLNQHDVAGGNHHNQQQFNSAGSRGGRSGRGDGGGHLGAGGRGGTRSEPTRDAVPNASSERVRWIANKKQQWELSKLIYEFGGPNKTNWMTLVSSGDVGVLREVFELLGREEVREDNSAAPLFQPLSSNSSIGMLSQYIEDGPLSEDSIEEVCGAGRGGAEWSSLVQNASDFLNTVKVVLQRFSLTISLPMIGTVLSGLRSSITQLVPTPDEPDVEWNEEEDSTALANLMLAAEVEALKPWNRLCAASERAAVCARAKMLRELYCGVVSYVKGLKTSEKERKIEAERRVEEEARAKRDSHHNARHGNRFLNEALHDRDYMSMSAIPTPERLLSKEASRLPQNLVVPPRRRGDNDNDEEDCMDDVSHHQTAPPIAAQYKYRNVDHYLNTHFLLLSEDCLAELKRGISDFRERLCVDGVMPEVLPVPTAEVLDKAIKGSSKRGNNTRCNMYTHVEVKNLETNRQGLGFVVTFAVASGQKVDWAQSSRFMNGSLLCLSSDGTFNAETLVVATVMRSVQWPRDEKDKLKLKAFVPSITIEVDAASFERFNVKHVYTMIESPVFFEAYRPVLRALQELSRQGLPFENLLLGHTNVVDPPSYIITPAAAAPRSAGRFPGQPPAPVALPFAGWDMSAVFPNFVDPVTSKRTWNPLASTGRGRVKMPFFNSNPPLDESQRAAIALALSCRLALIQGPPGCGKTFVGVLITKLLLANRKLRKDRPIVFICQTNHALDQILEHVFEFEQNMVRIGGRSESATMQGLSLQVKSKEINTNLRRTPAEMEARDKLNVLLAKIKSDVAQMSLARSLPNEKLALSDSHLARLRCILACYGKEGLVDGLLNRPADNATVISFNLLKASIIAKEKARKSNDPLPYWILNYDNWLDLSAVERAHFLAAYSDKDTISRSGADLSLFSAWLDSRDNVNVKTAVQDVAPTLNSNKFSQFDEDEDESNLEVDDEAEFFLDRQLEASDWINDVDLSGMRRNNRDEQASMAATNSAVCANLDEFEETAGLTPAARSLLRNPAVTDLYSLNKGDRRIIAEALIQLLCADGSSGSQSNMELYKAAHAEESKFFARSDAEILKGAAVIGLTTTGAAKHGATLRALGSEVLIVEEAAEVLEGSILAALTESTKHVILIGDHQQLRPTVNEYNLSTKHNLEISMFERLINSGFPHVTLTTQRRMHPDISSLITPAIYKRLLNADSVHQHPKITGVRDRLYFINHQHLEDSESSHDKLVKKEAADQGGRSNSHEARMVLALAQYLLLNGYSAKNLVILTMYKQQLRLMKQMARSNTGIALIKDSLSDIRVTTTDNYQGEECDVVLLSLVRSNVEKKAGFVKIENRVCVALSRARNGMFVIGNFDMIRESSPLWDQVCTLVESRGQMGPTLCLQCDNHQDSVNEVTVAEDFNCAPVGGCLKRCIGKFPGCGHACTLLCHPIKHEDLNCPDVCIAPREPGCTHPCKQRCWEKCRPCDVKVKRTRNSCGHSLVVKCSEEVEDARCTNPCPTSMICGHNCIEDCSHNHPSNYKCKQSCSKTRLTCSHPCPKRCYEQCGDCRVPKTFLLPCGHSLEAMCSTDITGFVCKDKCTKKLAGCDHLCRKLCHEQCETVCQEVVKKTVPTCRNLRPHQVKEKCGVPLSSDKVCKEKCSAVLGNCGHVCQGTCGMCLAPGVDLKSVKHMDCNKACDRMLPCNHKCATKHRCGTVCSPCEKPCAVVCSHKKCTLFCGAPCEPCNGLCTSVCSHVHSQEQLCVENCHSITESEDSDGSPLLCNLPCPLLLNCKHPCNGLCGEICPSICKICMLEKVKTAVGFFLQGKKPSKAEVDAARFIMLNCKHSFEVNALDSYVLKESTSDHYPCCPDKRCHTTIQGVFRYSSIMRQSMDRLRPPYYELREQTLLADFRKDLGLKNFKAVVDRMRLKLASTNRSGEEASRENPLLEFCLGTALLKTGQCQEASQRLGKALGSLNDLKLKAECANALGLLYLRQTKNFGKAIDLFEQAIRFDDSFEEPQRHLVEAKDTVQREQERLEHLARANLLRQQTDSAAKEKTIRATVGTSGEDFAEQALAAQVADSLLKQQEADEAQELERSGGNALHLAVLRGRTQDIIELLQFDKTLASLQDNFKNTPLHYAAKSRYKLAVELLIDVSPWHLLNVDGSTFVDEAINDDRSRGDDTQQLVQRLVEEASLDTSDKSDPSKRWTALRFLEKWRCVALDDLMLQVGLFAVKREALSVFCSVKEDLQRPFASRMFPNSMLHFAFVGNPGVGKTTVAGIFSRMLSELGLRGKKYVETTGRKLLQAGSSKFADTLKNSTPGILFIDEVYQLDPMKDREGMAIADQLVDVCESNRTELTVIVAGYKDDVLEKFFACNQGLPSRFTRIVTFEDFNEEQLRVIFVNMVEQIGWKLQPPDGDAADIATIVARRLARGSSKKGFGNARSVRNLLENGQKAASERLGRERLQKKKHTDEDVVTLFRRDILGDPFSLNSSKVSPILDNMQGLDAVKKAVRSLAAMATENLKSEEAGEPVLEVSLHRMFLGNPGTGKTTVAKLYGRLLAEMGFLSNGEVVVRGASTLTGAHVGSTATIVNALLDSVKGKVLVIDEAYTLSTSQFGREALDVLVERVQGGTEDFAVILCGYNDDMRKMLTANDGLARRFRSEDAFQFEDYSDAQLSSILQSMAIAAGLFISPQIADSVVAKVIAKKRGKKTFGNAGEVENLLNRAKEKFMGRNGKKNARGVKVILEEDLLVAHRPPFDPTTSIVLRDLNNMQGLDAVKKAVRSLAAMATENLKSEEAGEPVLEVSLHRMFLGNPGTGKTTVAKLYGRLLAEMGFLSNGEVIVKGASTLMGSHVGSTATIVNDLLDSVAGKVLVIDEAYVLTNSIYGREALDVLVERVQGGAEDFAVILCGYNDDMRKMLTANDGLARRFRSEDAFQFEDYSDAQLVAILLSKARSAKMSISAEIAEAVVRKMTARKRGKKGFGNAGEIDILLNRAKENYSGRTGLKDSNNFKIILEEDLGITRRAPFDPTASISLRDLNNMQGLEAVKKAVRSLAAMATENLKSEEAGEPVLEVSLHRMFLGNPGTGKTTVAKLYGRLLTEMGFLSNGEVVVRGASTLTGAHVGSTATIVNDLLDSVAGKVLVIDEAYVLEGSMYGKEALNVLVERVQGAEDFAVILCGYNDDMYKMLSCNSGLARRFRSEDAFQFEDYSDAQLVAILLNKARAAKMNISPEIAESVVRKMTARKRGKKGFGNAGEIDILLNRAKENYSGRAGLKDSNNFKIILEEDLLAPERPAVTDTVTDLAGLMTTSLQIGQQQMEEMFSQATESQSAPIRSGGIMTTETAPKSPLAVEIASIATEKLMEKEMEDDGSTSSGFTIWAALEEACSELSYSLLQLVSFLRTGDYPQELLQLVQNKSRSQDITEVRQMLEPQRGEMLGRVEETLRAIEAERLRRIEEERQAQDARAKEALRVKLAEEQRVQERLRQLGNCPMNFAWIRQGSGYRCAGGSHFVSAAEVNYTSK